MRSLVHVGSCQGGMVHLSIGAITVRLDQETFQFVAQEVSRHAEKMQEPPAKPQFTLVPRGGPLVPNI